jgi:hypothetical protein
MGRQLREAPDEQEREMNESTKLQWAIEDYIGENFSRFSNIEEFEAAVVAEFGSTTLDVKAMIQREASAVTQKQSEYANHP